MVNVRSLGKRLIGNGPFRKHAKSVWDKIKVSQDRKAFKRLNNTTPYVILSKDKIQQLRQKGYFSQIGQDYFLDQLFPKNSGTFIDIGANKPDSNSNTLFFEKKGWSGFAFDPIKSFKELWKTRQNTVFINAGISPNVQMKDFVEIQPKEGWEHALSGFKEYVREEDLRDFDFREYQVECGPIAHFIPENERFDFVSIDVEGAEDLILSSFDFNISPPLAIIIENNHEMGGTQRHREFLSKNGYQLCLRLNASDDLFVHKDHDIPKGFDLLLQSLL